MSVAWERERYASDGNMSFPYSLEDKKLICADICDMQLSGVELKPYPEILDGLLSFSEVSWIWQSQVFWSPAQGVLEEGDNRGSLEEGSGGHVHVQSEPMIARPQTLLVTDPKLQVTQRLNSYLCMLYGIACWVGHAGPVLQYVDFRCFISQKKGLCWAEVRSSIELIDTWKRLTSAPSPKGATSQPSQKLARATVVHKALWAA